MKKNIAHLDTSVLDSAAKFFRVMQKAGADFTGPMQSIEQRTNLVEYLNLGCPRNTALAHLKYVEDEVTCRLLFEDDFISPDEVERAYGVAYSNEMREHLLLTLPSFKTLVWLKNNNYMLVAGPPFEINLLWLNDVCPELFISKPDCWYSQESELFFRYDFVRPGEWLMVRKSLYPGSTKKTWEEQTALFTTREYVPNIADFTYAVTLYYLLRKTHLFPQQFVRTASLTSKQSHVCLGEFDTSGLVLNGYPDEHASEYLGIASAYMDDSKL